MLVKCCVFLLLIVIELITLTFTDTINGHLRVLGGIEADPSSVFYVASVRFNNVHKCGGSIISSQAIITAAHCVYHENELVKSEELSVRLGSTNQLTAGLIVPIKSVVIHPEYSGFKNNLAILLIESPLTWTNRIKSIMLATTSVEELNRVRVSGWGVQPNSGIGYKLHTNNLYVTTDEKCRKSYPDHDNSTFCVEHILNEGNCFGDGGNGADMNNFLVGVANIVMGACGSRYPDIYTDVAYHFKWIKSVLSDANMKLLQERK